MIRLWKQWCPFYVFKMWKQEVSECFFGKRQTQEGLQQIPRTAECFVLQNFNQLCFNELHPRCASLKNTCTDFCIKVASLPSSLHKQNTSVNFPPFLFSIQRTFFIIIYSKSSLMCLYFPIIATLCGSICFGTLVAGIQDNAIVSHVSRSFLFLKPLLVEQNKMNYNIYRTAIGSFCITAPVPDYILTHPTHILTHRCYRKHSKC